MLARQPEQLLLGRAVLIKLQQPVKQHQPLRCKVVQPSWRYTRAMRRWMPGAPAATTRAR